jgi:hypothetical protein
MSFLFSSNLPEQKLVKQSVDQSDSDRRILTKSELADFARHLSYALPSLIMTGVHRRDKAMHSGKKGGAEARRYGKLYIFPSPERTSMLNKTYDVVQTIPLATFTNSITVPVYGSYSVTFGVLDNATNFGAVFDQYRIALVEVTFSPQVNMNYVGSGTNDGQYVTVVDLDDTTNLTSFNTGLDYPGAIVTQLIKPHKHTFVPHIAVAAYSGAFTSFANEEAPWIDVASPSVQHYGVKYACNTASTYASSVTVIIRVWLQLRNVR